MLLTSDYCTKGPLRPVPPTEPTLVYNSSLGTAAASEHAVLTLVAQRPLKRPPPTEDGRTYEGTDPSDHTLCRANT